MPQVRTNDVETDLTMRLDLKVSDAVQLIPEGKDRFISRPDHYWLPAGSYGVQGGQILGQALFAAGQTVPDAWTCNFHSGIFVYHVSLDQPVRYQVERIRDGRSVCFRRVTGYQKKKCQDIIVFIASASFNKDVKDEKMSSQWPMPTEIVPVEQSESMIEHYTRVSEGQPNDVGKRFWAAYRNNFVRGVIEIRNAEKDIHPLEQFPYRLWMRSTNPVAKDQVLQKAALCYMMDLNTIQRIPRAITEDQLYKGSAEITALVSLNLNAWFYDDDFDVSDWLLFSQHAPKVSGGRGIVLGTVYSREGKLLVIFAHEGLGRVKDLAAHL